MDLHFNILCYLCVFHSLAFSSWGVFSGDRWLQYILIVLSFALGSSWQSLCILYRPQLRSESFENVSEG